MLEKPIASIALQILLVLGYGIHRDVFFAELTNATSPVRGSSCSRARNTGLQGMKIIVTTRMRMLRDGRYGQNGHYGRDGQDGCDGCNGLDKNLGNSESEI